MKPKPAISWMCISALISLIVRILVRTTLRKYCHVHIVGMVQLKEKGTEFPLFLKVLDSRAYTTGTYTIDLVNGGTSKATEKMVLP